MTVVIGLLLGAVTVRFLCVAGRSILAVPALARVNYRNQTVPTAAGILIVLALLIIEAGRAILGALGVGEDPGLTLARSEVLFAVFGFGFLGLIDDLLGTSSDRGFRGHARALAEGRITTGFVKLLGGAGVAVVLVATPGFATGRRLIVDAILIALAANLGNLLDLAPGRTIKGAAIVYLPLAIAVGVDPIGVAIAPVMGAAFGLLPDDLGERLMIGDTGAMVIGSVLGLGVVLGTSSGTRVAVLIALVALNVFAEVMSFSRVIDRVAPLRAFDRWGQRGPGRPPRRSER